jgi:cytochrome oxidase Cu insertion factor (SCO1/SenC/PrrC family)
MPLAGERRNESEPGSGTGARRGRAALQPGERLALAGLAFLLTVSAAWWAAALWPLPATTPEWVVRARAACFGVERSGLPHAGGWILLVGSPISLLAALIVIAGPTLRSALRASLGTVPGRLLCALAGGAFAAVVLGSGWRAVGAAGIDASGSGWPLPKPIAAALGAAVVDAEVAPVVVRPHAMPAGLLGLRDQRGEMIEATRFAGAPLLVTFAFGRCETICPTIVHETLAARAELGARAPPLVIITVDPWRDAPLRLPHIAAMWRLDDDAHLLGGHVAAVERVLDSWRVERSRDERTGDVVHPSLVYVLDGGGRVRYAVPAWRDHILAALDALGADG